MTKLLCNQSIYFLCISKGFDTVFVKCILPFPGLFYDGIGNEIGTEMALLEANKLNMQCALAEAKAIREVCSC